MKMNRFLRLLICIAAIVSTFVAVRGADDGMRRLMSEGGERIDRLFMGQQLNTRLDMLDYFDAGTGTYSKDDVFRTKIRIAELSDRHVRLDADSLMSIDIYLLVQGPDSLIVTVANLPISAGDCAIDVRDVATGNKTEDVSVNYADWIDTGNMDGLTTATLTAMIPFVTASAAVDTGDGDITLTNKSIQVPGLDPGVVKAFKPTLTLQRKGGKYVIKKK